MCDYFWQRMAKSKGDLTDIFRGSGFAPGDIPITISDNWTPPTDPASIFPLSTDGFLDSFDGIEDPALHELESFLGSPETTASSNSSAALRDVIHHQIAPLAGSKTMVDIRKPPPLFIDLPGTSKACDRAAIPLPQAPAIRRRKSQTRKVVCIPAPAPAPANSKTGGEVVPSDLWAWRKYGQKPIKGSPYPRGYYRCSSSKGCSARKQVERSRTDPNMLVVTYTSDHNHPWPTQRNTLAGSSRSQSSKTNNPSSSKSYAFNVQNLRPSENFARSEEAKMSPILISSIPPVDETRKEMENMTMVEHLHDDFDHKSFNEIEPDDFFADLDPFCMFGWDGGNSKIG